MINLLFFGDCVFSKETIFRDFLSLNLKNLINEHHLISCNFEAPIINKECTKNIKAGPHLANNDLLPDFLEKNGFNVINLANNHIMDYGRQGLQQTRKAFSEQAVLVGCDDETIENRCKIITVKGKKIGFISLAEGGFGYCKENNIGYQWINHSSVNNLIQNSKSEVDFLIVNAHAGLEMFELPLPVWRARYKEIIRYGADVIIGHHPHVPQGYEKYNNGMIFYSLGNFIFNTENDNPLWNKSYAVSLTLQLDNNVHYNIIPLFFDGINVYIDESESTIKYLTNLNEQMKDIDIYENIVSEKLIYYWEEIYKNYYYFIFNGIDGKASLMKKTKIFIKNLISRNMEVEKEILLLHNLFIESHRWVVERVLYDKYKKQSR